MNNQGRGLTWQCWAGGKLLTAGFVLFILAEAEEELWALEVGTELEFPAALECCGRTTVITLNIEADRVTHKT